MAGNCTIGFEATDGCITKFNLFDITGKEICYKQELLVKGYHSYNLSGLGSGIYTLKIESDNFIYTAKIVSNDGVSGNIEINHTGIANRNEITSLPSGKLKGNKSPSNYLYAIQCK